MDANVLETPPPSQKSSSLTPTAVILARNIQKFFQAKSDLLSGSKSRSNDGNSDLDVPAVLKDIDEILESRSVDDGRMLLRGMVADLLKEVDLLRFRGEATAAQLATVKEERDVVNNEYRDHLVSLLRALQHYNDLGCINKNGKPSKSSEDLIQQRLSLQNADCSKNDSKLLTAEEATMLTIQALTRKIEALNIENTDQKQQLAVARERNEDLESINAAQQFKIAALEKQFCSINQKRHKAVAQMQAANGPSRPSSSYSSSSSSTKKDYKMFVPPKLQVQKENTIPPNDALLVAQQARTSEKASVSAALAMIQSTAAASTTTPLQSSENKKVVVVSPPSEALHRSGGSSLKERAAFAAKKPKSRLASSTRLVKLVDQMS
jgi:hypothetical protein